jgi:L-ascorbate metabolism protein UlaG (beta-lactamase superfamily)
MDAPLFAQLTKAKLVGSRSTMNVARGLPLPESQLQEVVNGQTVPFDKFQLTFIGSKHASPNLARGTVDKPFKTPARARMWRSKDCWSVIVRHEQRSLLVHGSANFERNALRDRRADVVYLGIGLLGRRSQRFVDEYWNEVVRQTGATRVILVHWDDLFRSLDEPLIPMTGPLEDFAAAVRKVHCASSGREEILLPTAWEPTDPFAGLTQAT